MGRREDWHINTNTDTFSSFGKEFNVLNKKTSLARGEIFTK